MKVLLLKDVPGTGRKNDIKDVNDGFARNFLIARKLAIPATEGKVKEMQQEKQHKEDKQQSNRNKYQDIADALGKADVVIHTKVGERGKAFGSIGSLDIKKALVAMGHTVEEEWINLDEPIKTTGTVKVPLKFPHGVAGALSVTVKPE